MCKMQELRTFVKCKRLGKIISVRLTILFTSLAIVNIWQIMHVNFILVPDENLARSVYWPKLNRLSVETLTLVDRYHVQKLAS